MAAELAGSMKICEPHGLPSVFPFLADLAFLLLALTLALTFFPHFFLKRIPRLGELISSHSIIAVSQIVAQTHISNRIIVLYYYYLKYMKNKF